MATTTTTAKDVLERGMALFNEQLNPDQKPSNIFKILALVVVVYGFAKTRQIRGLIREDGKLHTLPALHGVAVPGTSGRAGHSATIRHYLTPTSGDLPRFPSAGVVSLYHSFQHGVEHYPNARCLGARQLVTPASEDGRTAAVHGDFQWLTYAEVSRRAQHFGAGLKKLAQLGRQSFVGLYASNQVAWVIAEQAANAYALVTVPLYDTLGAEAAQYILKQTQMSVVVCTHATYGKVLESAPACPALKTVVLIDGEHEPVTTAEREHAERLQLKLYSFGEVERCGAQQAPGGVDPPTADDVATLMYTSGTTGDPKGAVLTHGNFMACLAGLLVCLGDARIDDSDAHLSFLPLAHVFERLVQTQAYYCGAAVGFFRGSIAGLIEDIGLLRPTFFPSVPRLLNRVYDKISAAVQQLPPVKRALFNMAYAAKREYLYAEGAVVHPFWDRLVFAKMAAVLGGRLRWILTGAAPIAPETLEFLRIVFSCRVMEGYGQTEGTGVGTATCLNDVAVGHVGPPNPAAEIKLVDVPDMDYLVTDRPNPRGELCVRGPAVIRGYYLLPDKTAETIDDEGWLHSGDVAELLPHGCFRIVDRKKNLFKLAQGEYVAPEKIENIVIRSPYIAQCFVYGDSLQPHLVAVVVPDEEVVTVWAHANALAHLSFVELCRQPELRDMLYSDVLYRCKEAALGGFEIPKAIHVSSTPFTVENDILTPTLKLKRNIAQKVYAHEIKQLYQQSSPQIQASL